MADNKKSFVIYCDLINTIDHLTTLEKGKLFEHLLDYVNDKNPVLNDRVLLGTWKHLEQSLKRDLKKYEARADRSRENGALGGRPPKNKEPKKPNGLIDNPQEPKKPDTVTVTVTDIVTDNESINTFTHESFLLWFKECREYLGLKFNVKKLSPIEKQLFNELKEYTKNDFKVAFKNFSSDKYWNDPTKNLLMPKPFLNPETFTKYLNAEVKTELTLGEKLMGRVQQ